MMCWNSHPVTQAPETDKIVEGLMREDLFMVSAEHFISDTAAYADILLPAAMGAEMEDMILSWGHLYLTYNTKCAEAPGEAIPNNEIFRRLAQRLAQRSRAGIGAGRHLEARRLGAGRAAGRQDECGDGRGRGRT